MGVGRPKQDVMSTAVLGWGKKKKAVCQGVAAEDVA